MFRVARLVSAALSVLCICVNSASFSTSAGSKYTELLGESTTKGEDLGCYMHNYCNGHGICMGHSMTCDCYDGWGSASDAASGTFETSADCSARGCPVGKAWVGI
jgi:hypothetical protein